MPPRPLHSCEEHCDYAARSWTHRVPVAPTLTCRDGDFRCSYSHCACPLSAVMRAESFCGPYDSHADVRRLRPTRYEAASLLLRSKWLRASGSPSTPLATAWRGGAQREAAFRNARKVMSVNGVLMCGEGLANERIDGGLLWPCKRSPSRARRQSSGNSPSATPIERLHEPRLGSSVPASRMTGFTIGVMTKVIASMTARPYATPAAHAWPQEMFFGNSSVKRTPNVADISV